MIGITIGEHFGIGYEILAKALSVNPLDTVLLYGDKKHFQLVCKEIDTYPHASTHIEWLDIPCTAKNADDKKDRAKYVLHQLTNATKDALDNKIDALVTCPIDKNTVRFIEPNFDGHTSFLQRQSKATHSFMLMANQKFHIIVGTQHIPLRSVHEVFTKAYFEDMISNLIPSLSKHFAIDNPKIAVLGLNPHAGEIDDHSEEKLWMKDTIKSMHARGLHIEGPFPADSFFGTAQVGKWDIIISPYHDQALIAAKYEGLSHVVNITLGLPFLRTSPGHGVAYDIVGRGIADPSSLQNAIKVATSKHL